MTLTQLTVESDWLTPTCSTTEQYKHIKADSFMYPDFCNKNKPNKTYEKKKIVCWSVWRVHALMCLYCSVVLQMGVSQSDPTVSCVNVISVLWPF